MRFCCQQKRADPVRKEQIIGVSSDVSIAVFDTTYIHCEKAISRVFST